ncbi:hypothetical protein [Amphibiibacter pelophylacis]|uniref:Uncharacterized protein n=1 Tax=Amphibiibacter pelophylacis TaxID=1799477 RepID=A0ACC6P0Y2_9BURK
MRTQTSPKNLRFNPFSALVEPERVLAAVASSERLAQLESRICRPLDKPIIPHVATGVAPEDDLPALRQAS